MSGVIRGTDSILIGGPCPFLTCLETGPHGHDVCPECDAVRFGNPYCRHCVTHAYWPEDFRAMLLAIIDQRSERHEES